MVWPITRGESYVAEKGKSMGFRVGGVHRGDWRKIPKALRIAQMGYGSYPAIESVPGGRRNLAFKLVRFELHEILEHSNSRLFSLSPTPDTLSHKCYPELRGA